MSGDLRERIAEVITRCHTNGLCPAAGPCADCDCHDPQHELELAEADAVMALVQAELARAWDEGWDAGRHSTIGFDDRDPNPYAAAPAAEGRSETHEFVKRLADLRCGRVDCNRHADDPVHQVPAAAADCNCGLSEIAPCPAHPPAEPGAPFPHRGLFELRKASDEVAATDPAVVAAARSYDEMVERIRAERRPTVVRTRRLLDRSGLGASTTGRMGFHREDPDNADNDTYMTVSWATWGALGMPDQVTVTIEPGDLLNAAGPPAETPLPCSNCGKPIAEHDAMASCWTAKPHAQNPVTPMVVGADDRTPAAPLDVPHPFRPLWGDPESCGVARPDGSTCLFVADADIHRTSAAEGTQPAEGSALRCDRSPDPTLRCNFVAGHDGMHTAEGHWWGSVRRAVQTGDLRPWIEGVAGEGTTGTTPPPAALSLPVVLCPACAHGIDPHGVNGRGDYPGCGVGDENRVLCGCKWTPNDIAATLLAAAGGTTPTAEPAHEFVPRHPDWDKPRCKVGDCREFADHPVHQPATSSGQEFHPTLRCQGSAKLDGNSEQQTAEHGIDTAPCPTCQGRNRHTVDMVCMDCGRDYMPDDGSDETGPGTGWKRLMGAWRGLAKVWEAERDDARGLAAALEAELARVRDAVNVGATPALIAEILDEATDG